MGDATAAMTVSEALADRIVAAGTRVAFGHPGGEVVHLIAALERRGVRFMAAHHEAVAGYMALGYAEFTGRPGVSVSTIGPGAANALPSVAAALLERAPVLALTGSRAPEAQPRSTHQSLDLEAAFGPISKGSMEVTAANVAWAIPAALATALAPRPGPVHLAISSETAQAPMRDTALPAPPFDADASAPGPPRPPDPDALARARSLLASARRPAVIVGMGVADRVRASAALELVRAIGGPAVSTPKSKGVVPEDDPLYAGNLEGAGDDLVVELLRRADLVVCLGVDSVEFAKPWRLDIPVLHVDDEPGDGYYEPTVEVFGDVEQAMRALGGAVNGAAARWAADQVAATRRELAAYVEGTAVGVRPARVIAAVRAALPREAITSVDVGAHKILLCQAWPAYSPRTFFIANGLSPMGYAVPVGTAIGVVEAGAPKVAFVGDGGLSMYLGELETAVRFGVDLLIVVFADESLELIRLAQARADLPQVGTAFGNPDWQALGRAFRVAVHEVGSDEEVEGTVAKAVDSRGVRLLVAHIDRGAYRL